jgi:transposase
MVESLREMAGAGLSSACISRGIEHEFGIPISISALSKAAQRYGIKLRGPGGQSRWPPAMIEMCLQLRETMTAKEIATHLSKAFDISIKSETVRNFLNDRGLPPKPERPWAAGPNCRRDGDPPVPPRPQWGEYRSLTAYLFGDPQPGRSALDQRMKTEMHHA